MIARRNTILRPALLLAGACLSFVRADVAEAQRAPSPDAANYSPAFVEAGHWSIGEARRLAGAGLAPVGFDAGRRVYTQREIASLLSFAERRAAAEDDNAAQRMLRSLAARFAEEFLGAGGPFRGSAASASVSGHEGDVTTGWGYWYGYPNGVEVTPPQALPAITAVSVVPALQWTPFDDVAVRLSVNDPAGDREPELDESYIVAEWRGVRAWAGRHGIGYGPGESGGITLSDGAQFNGFGVQNRRPLHLPWILRELGPVGFDFTFARFDLPHSFDDVGFFATRGSISPHHRVQLGVTRAAMFGGEGNSEADLFAVLSMLIGKHAGDVSELDNQVVSVDMAYRPPVERWLPLRLYLEWGFEDSAGAWRDVPGILAGLQVPVVPGMPALGVGIEHTRFEGSCCGNPIWYRHSTFHDGWTRDGTPLGHPLGGHGRQWTAYGSASVADGRLRTTALLFRRERLLESLYTPDRLGRSLGLELQLDWRALSWLELSGTQRLEDGEDWRRSSTRVGLRAFL